MLRAIASTAEIGRSIVTTPDVPGERLAALRKAFQDMLGDPDFIEACKQRNIMLEPASGEDMDSIQQEIVNLPKPLVDKIGMLPQQ